MDRRYFVLFLASQLFISFLILLAWFIFASNFSKRSNDALKNVDSRIETIVISTLSKVREDIGIISPPSESQNEDKKPVKIEGANLSTFEHHFYIDGTPFFIGDVVSPYGMAVQVGRDCVVFDDLNGGLILLGKNLPKIKDSKFKKEPDKNDSVVGERA